MCLCLLTLFGKKGSGEGADGVSSLRALKANNDAPFLATSAALSTGSTDDDDDDDDAAAALGRAACRKRRAIDIAGSIKSL
jgi:hypothetical protein